MGTIVAVVVVGLVVVGAILLFVARAKRSQGQAARAAHILSGTLLKRRLSATTHASEGQEMLEMLRSSPGELNSVEQAVLSGDAGKGDVDSIKRKLSVYEHKRGKVVGGLGPDNENVNSLKRQLVEAAPDAELVPMEWTPSSAFPRCLHTTQAGLQCTYQQLDGSTRCPRHTCQRDGCANPKVSSEPLCEQCAAEVSIPADFTPASRGQASQRRPQPPVPVTSSPTASPAKPGSLQVTPLGGPMAAPEPAPRPRRNTVLAAAVAAADVDYASVDETMSAAAPAGPREEPDYLEPAAMNLGRLGLPAGASAEGGCDTLRSVAAVEPMYAEVDNLGNIAGADDAAATYDEVDTVDAAPAPPPVIEPDSSMMRPRLDSVYLGFQSGDAAA